MQLDILNAATGHTTLTFDTSNAEQAQQAETQVNDLLRQGYSVFVENEGKTERITSFDAKRGVYLIGSKEAPAQSATATAVAPSAGGCISR